MSNIVERLRAYVKDEGGWYNILETCEEAADEIERLRAENARLREALERISKLENVTVSDFDGTEWEHQRIARAALKQSEPKP